MKKYLLLLVPLLLASPAFASDNLTPSDVFCASGFSIPAYDGTYTYYGVIPDQPDYISLSNGTNFLMQKFNDANYMLKTANDEHTTGEDFYRLVSGGVVGTWVNNYTPPYTDPDGSVSLGACSSPPPTPGNAISASAGSALVGSTVVDASLAFLIILTALAGVMLGLLIFRWGFKRIRGVASPSGPSYMDSYNGVNFDAVNRKIKEIEARERFHGGRHTGPGY